MNTPVQRLIEAVEKGYNQNPALWQEWKNTMLAAENEMLRNAFLCGDNSDFHLNIKGIKSFDDYLSYYKNCK